MSDKTKSTDSKGAFSRRGLFVKLTVSLIVISLLAVLSFQMYDLYLRKNITVTLADNMFLAENDQYAVFSQAKVIAITNKQTGAKITVDIEYSQYYQGICTEDSFYVSQLYSTYDFAKNFLYQYDYQGSLLAKRNITASSLQFKNGYLYFYNGYTVRLFMPYVTHFFTENDITKPTVALQNEGAASKEINGTVFYFNEVNPGGFFSPYTFAENAVQSPQIYSPLDEFSDNIEESTNQKLFKKNKLVIGSDIYLLHRQYKYEDKKWVLHRTYLYKTDFNLQSYDKILTLTEDACFLFTNGNAAFYLRGNEVREINFQTMASKKIGKINIAANRDKNFEVVYCESSFILYHKLNTYTSNRELVYEYFG